MIAWLNKRLARADVRSDIGDLRKWTRMGYSLKLKKKIYLSLNVE
jgi:hypothetical protein